MLQIALTQDTQRATIASVEVAMDYDAGHVIIPRGGWSHIITRHTTGPNWHSCHQLVRTGMFIYYVVY